jgi:DNA-binding beta-propeller fold protein YncE
MLKCGLCGIGLLLASGGVAFAQPPACTPETQPPSATIDLPRAPFAAIPSQDGCWAFVSVPAGIAVLKRDPEGFRMLRVAPAPGFPTGMVLTHDGQLLIVAATDRVLFVDVGLLTGGAENAVLSAFSSGRRFSGSIYANVTADDHWLFVSEESSASITVIDLARARSEGYKEDAIIGDIPAGRAPIALPFSRDGKWLFSTSELALPAWQWPAACTAEGSDDPAMVRPEGALVVIDVAKAEVDPPSSITARVPAGCSPVRAAMTPDGASLFVTARNSNAVLEFDTSKLISDPANARVGSAPTGPAPVPVAVVNDGRMLVLAGNSNRFAGAGAPQTLTVLDAAKIPQGAAAVLGTIATGSFPREMHLSADGRTLFLTNAGSRSVQILDVAHLPITPPPNAKPAPSAVPESPIATASPASLPATIARSRNRFWCAVFHPVRARHGYCGVH